MAAVADPEVEVAVDVAEEDADADIDVGSLLEADNNKSELERNVGVLGGHWSTERTDPAASAKTT